MMMMSNKKTSTPNANQRWYQKDKTLLSLVNKLQKMPTALMETYCKCIIDYALELYKQDTNKRLFIEAGSEKHQGLIKSLDKKRWFDKNPYSYRAFNGLYLMDELRRNDLALRLIQSESLLHAYNQRCLQCDCSPNLDVVGHLLLVFVNQGEQEALSTLNLLEAQGQLGRLINASN